MRFKCAKDECRDLDICPLCFTEGKEGQVHKAWHDYMVEVCLSRPTGGDLSVSGLGSPDCLVSVARLSSFHSLT